MILRILILFALCFGSASAATVVLKSPANVVKTGGSWATAGSAAFNAGSFNSGFTTSVAGRAVSVPATWRLAANAGQFAANAVRMNPTLLIGTAVASWLLPYGLEWIENQWIRGESVTIPLQYSCYTATGWACKTNAQDACTEYANYRNGGGVSVTCSPGGNDTMCSCSCVGPYCGGNYDTTITRTGQTSCPAGTTQNGAYCVGRITSPATQADWDAVASSPFVDPAAQELATKGVPLPLAPPEINPAPIDIPISDPYIDPVTGKRFQDIARVTPQPSQPDTAEVQTVKQEVDAQGQPVVDPATQQPVTPEEKEQDECKLFPDRLGCIDKGETDDEDLQTRDLGQSINPVSVGSGGSCPSDKQLSYLGKQITFSWSPICQGATWINPIVLAIAWLLAAYILVGAIREG